MRAVRGYEEKDPAIISQLTNGYPRFVVHPFAKQLAAHFLTTTPALAGRHLWLTSSAPMARALADHLAARSADRSTAVSPGNPPPSLPLSFSASGLHGLAHLTDATTAARLPLWARQLREDPGSVYAHYLGGLEWDDAHQ
jgi:hypothetical protein